MSADLIRRLIDAGTPAELIAEVALLAGEAAALERRRAADRERQSARRHVTSRDTTDVTDTAEMVSLDKEKPQTPKKLNPSVCVNIPPRARGYHRLPEDWVPTRPLPPKTQAKVDLWPPGCLDDELAAFHRWAANAKDENGKGRKLDWDKAWVNWTERRNDEHHGRKSNGMGRHQPDDGIGPSARAAIDVFGAPPETPTRLYG